MAGEAARSGHGVGIIVLVRRAQFDFVSHNRDDTDKSRKLSHPSHRRPLHGQLKGTAERCRQSVSEVARGILVDAMLRKIGVHSSGYVADTRRPLKKAIGAAA